MLVIKWMSFVKLNGTVVKTKIKQGSIWFRSHLPTLGPVEQLSSPISLTSQYLPTELLERAEAKRCHKGWALKEGKAGLLVLSFLPGPVVKASYSYSTGHQLQANPSFSSGHPRGLWCDHQHFTLIVLPG